MQMADQLDVARKFVAALKEGSVEALTGLLADEPAFQQLNVDLKGRDAVLGRLTAPGTSGVYHASSWEEPVRNGAAVKAVGRMPPGSPVGGVILTLHVVGDRVATVQQQPIPGTPRAPSELKLPADLKQTINSALASRHPMLVSYVDAEGQPVLAFRGSTQAFSDTQLAIWVRNAGGRFATSIATNPKVALMYRDEDSKATYQFAGRARIDADEATRKTVFESAAKVEQDHDFARTGVAVIIDLDRVEGYAGLSPTGPVNPVRMAR
jgi:Pyridoxamine 5'-phosphate oxidase